MLPLGGKTAAVLGIWNWEEIISFSVTAWRRLYPSIYKGLASNAFCRKCLVRIPQTEQFHICPAIGAWIVNVEVFHITFVILSAKTRIVRTTSNFFSQNYLQCLKMGYLKFQLNQGSSLQVIALDIRASK